MKEAIMEEMMNPIYREGYQKGYTDCLAEMKKRLEVKDQDYMKGVHYDLQTVDKPQDVTAQKKVKDCTDWCSRHIAS